MIKLVETDGWYQVTQPGSHRQYKHPTRPGRTMITGKPSDTLPTGTEQSILKQAGMTWRRR